MAENNLDRWWEDFKLGKKVKFKGGRSAGNGGVKGAKWSFFSKAGKGHGFGFKTAKKTHYAGKAWEQRSIAKVSYMKNVYPGQWGVHGRYLARQGAQLENTPGLGFDGHDEDLNISKTLRGWQAAGDPKLWKIIISPEMAHKLDLKEHVRAVMTAVQKDLGARFEWVAIGHYNTDNFHAHVVMRGVDKEGKEVRLDQKYIKQGFRQRSIQEATRVLGLRLEQDILLKRQENIKAMHLTDMDREIKHRLNTDGFIHLNCHSGSALKIEKELQLKGRLMFLEEMGLAQKDSSVSWQVDPGFSDYLKFIQTQRDIVKTKNKHVENILNPTLLVVINKLENVGDMLAGRIVGMGLSDSQNETRYMLIEGIDNKIHYVFATNAITKKRDGGDLKNGEIILLERKEFSKEEDQKIRYLSVEGFSSFKEIQQSQKLTGMDMVILKKFQEYGQIPAVSPTDGKVRKQFLDTMHQRIELMQRVNIIYDDFRINEDKLKWTLYYDMELAKGRVLRRSLSQGGS